MLPTDRGGANLPPPTALAMVLCEGIYEDPSDRKGKKTLAGVVQDLYAVSFPVVAPTVAVYVALTNGRGKVRFAIQVVDADETRAPIRRDETELNFDNPRQIAEVAVRLRMLQFPAPGDYRFQIFGSGQFLAERMLVVQQINLKGEIIGVTP